MVISHADDSSGGMQKQALSLAQALRTKGVSISILSKRGKTPNDGNGWDPKSKERPYLGVNMVPLPVTHRKPSWSFLFCFLLWASIRRNTFHVIHAHNASLGVISCLVGWLMNRKVIIKIPGMAYVEYLKAESLSKRIRRWVLLRRADRFIAVSSEMAQGLRQAGIPSKRICFIPNGIEDRTVCPTDDGAPWKAALKMELLGTVDVQVVLFTGRLVKEKGLDRLLKVWASLPDRAGRLLLIVGDGPLRERLEVQASALRLFPTVQFAGHKTPISKYYLIADLFVLPSESEGMSNSLLEAMAAGLPVIASDVGGNKDVIEDGVNGSLADWEKTQECAQILSRFLSDAHLRRWTGKNAALRAQTFSMGGVAERYIDLYRAVLAEQ
jgi:glycosyltransferase involved in cell wall biosynthesis